MTLLEMWNLFILSRVVKIIGIQRKTLAVDVKNKASITGDSGIKGEKLIINMLYHTVQSGRAVGTL